MTQAAQVDEQDFKQARANVARLIYDLTDKGINPDKVTVEIVPDEVAKALIHGSKGVNVRVRVPEEYRFSQDDLEALESSLTFDSPMQGVNARLTTEAIEHGKLEIMVSNMPHGAEATVAHLASGHLQPRRHQDSAHLTPPRPR